MPNAKDFDVTAETLNVMVVGSYGSGKSTFFTSFPTPGYLFDFDNQVAVYRGKDFDYSQYPMSPMG